MFDHNHGVARIDETVKNAQQSFDVRKVQAGCRFVEDVQRSPGGLFDEFAGEFDPLGLSAGERRRGLPDFHVVQADIVECREHRGDLGNVSKKLQRLLHVHVQDVADALALVENL